MNHVRLQSIPLVTSSAAYAVGDQIGSLITIDASAAQTPWVLRSIAVIERVSTPQHQPLTVLFFSDDPDEASADNQSVSFGTTATNELLGRAQVQASDYVTIPGGSGGFTARSMAQVQNLWVPLTPGLTSIYALVMTTGTPTYGTGTDRLRLVLGFENPRHWPPGYTP